MNANELRINNIVLANNVNERMFEPYVIKTGEDINNAKWFMPIPLTEDWLIKLGFTYRTDTGFDGWYPAPILGESIRIFEVEQGWFKYRSAHNVLKYVHQLQNLYFALTGNELTINP